MDIRDKTALLRTVLFRYADIPSTEWRFFVSLLQERAVRKREHILEAGQVSRHLTFIYQGGFLRQYLIRDGREVNTAFFAPGSFANDYPSFVRQAPSIYHMQALSDARVFVVCFEAMNELFDRHACWRAVTMQAGAYLQRRREERATALATGSAETRYLHLLGTCPRLVQSVPLYHIASYLGVTPERLSRIRRKLTRDGHNAPPSFS